MIRYVLFREDIGVFLGDFLGLGIWSKLDAAGQTEAVTFPDLETAIDYIRPQKNNCLCCAIPVECADEYATIEECVAAGLPAWGTNEDAHGMGQV